MSDLDASAVGLGTWAAYYSDRSGCCLFETELDALRYAVSRSMTVRFVRWGEDVFQPLNEPSKGRDAAE